MACGLITKLFVASAVIAISSCMPLHASCKIKWSFGMSCSDVKQKIATQVETWKTADGCKNGGEKCLYKMVSNTANKLTITHETPVHHYIDTLTILFTDTGSSCSVDGSSRSNTWYALLDAGTNYCNLRNLITGSGLDAGSGFSETTSDSVCTQYSSRNCTVY